MIRLTEELSELERRYAREIIGGLSYQEALARFTALWVEAHKLNPDFPGNWREDLDADLAVARAVNGLPPA